MQNITEIEAEIIEDFSLFDDWTDKYQYIIDLGQSLKGIPEVDKTDENLVRGCQSRVWLTASYRDGLVHFQADSDAIITKGLVALMMRVLSGQSPKTIVNATLSFTEKIGIREHLSPTRANGLNAMISKMKAYAKDFIGES